MKKVHKLNIDDGFNSYTGLSVEAIQGCTGISPATKGPTGIQGVTGIQGIEGVDYLRGITGCQTTDSRSVIIGEDHAGNNKTKNVIIGFSMPSSNSNGYNTLIGYNVCPNFSSGYYIIGIGCEAQTTEESNTQSIGIGYKSGTYSSIYGSYSVSIGQEAKAYKYSTVIGKNSYCSREGCVVIGNNISNSSHGLYLKNYDTVIGGSNITKTFFRGALNIPECTNYSSVEGTLRYDATNHKYKLYNGSSWVDL